MTPVPPDTAHHLGLGKPRGPAFVSPSFTARQGFAPARPGSPEFTPPSAAPPPVRKGRSAVVTAALVAALVAGLTGGAAGAVAAVSLGEPDAAPLPRSSAGAANGPGDMSDVAARVAPSVVSVEVRRGNGRATGSGFVIDRSGHIVTNAHVVQGGGDVSVVLSDRRRINARVVGSDSPADIAVLAIDPSDSPPPLTLGRSATVRVGDPVLALGSPLRLAGTVTGGIVSALNREVRLGDGKRQTAVQTDASINPGNSGGPLVNSRGEVVGINTAIATGGGSGNIGIGFAIPVDRGADIAQRIIRNG